MSEWRDWHVIVLIIFTFGFGVWSGYDVGEQSGWDLGYDECIMAAAKPVPTSCFERVVRYDRYIDYERNVVTNGYFYNTSWIRTECVEFEQDKYESLDVFVGVSEQ